MSCAVSTVYKSPVKRRLQAPTRLVELGQPARTVHTSVRCIARIPDPNSQAMKRQQRRRAASEADAGPIGDALASHSASRSWTRGLGFLSGELGQLIIFSRRRQSGQFARNAAKAVTIGSSIVMHPEPAIANSGATFPRPARQEMLRSRRSAHQTRMQTLGLSRSKITALPRLGRLSSEVTVRWHDVARLRWARTVHASYRDVS